MQQFTARDGVRISYRDEGSGRPLLLLHGLMAHSGFFGPQAPLARQFRLIAPDLRGHGASPAAPPLSVEQLADDVEALAERLDLKDAIGIGWSLGAILLWRLLAGRASGRFAGAVIVDMTPRVLNGPCWELGLSSEVCEARRQAIAEDFEAFAAAAGHAIFAQPLKGEAARLAPWAGEEFARNEAGAMASLWESLVGQDLSPSLAAIAQPTLIVHGAQSHLYGPGTADYLEAALPDARALSFADAGHAPHLEQPDLFNQSVRDFAASLPRMREPIQQHI